MSDKVRPIWLMDIDGVLNRWEIYRYPSTAFTSFEAESGFTISYNPEILERIVEMHDTGVVEVQWLTTWQSKANTELRETFGFKEDLVVAGGDSDMSEDHGWWKLTHVRDALAKHDRVIWTDDEIHRDLGSRLLIEQTPATKLFTIGPRMSLTHSHINDIEEWIKS